jgi:hypothetical protein
MGVAHFVTSQSPQSHLIDEHPARQPMVDDATASAAVARSAAQRIRRESHCARVPMRNT